MAASDANEPFINLSFAFESVNVSNFCSRIVSQDLPIAIRDPLVLEDEPALSKIWWTAMIKSPEIATRMG
jgi:hypothetical protein